jgi:hypothetical protein
MSESDRKKIYYVGNSLLLVVKWIILIFAVLYIGMTLGLIVTVLIAGNNLDAALLTKFTSVLLPYSKIKVSIFVINYGMEKVLTAVLGYTIANSLNNVLLYVLVSKFIVLFRNITIGDLFTKKSDNLATEIISISFMSTFLMPIMLFILSTTTNMFLDMYLTINFHGLFFMLFGGIMKVVIARGSQIVKENSRIDRTIDDYKADIDELKIQSIKREAELKELKKLVKTQSTETATPKAEETATKKRTHHHSRAKKTGTTTK